MLTKDQTQLYLKRLGITNTPDPTKENLDALIYAHQTKIPFETIGVHRCTATPDLSIEHLFQKIIENNNGGYCFELNKLFENLLTSLGYNARPALSRAVRGREGRMPINHRGILVDLDKGLFFADVGFGGPMPAGALQIDTDEEQNICDETFITESTDHGWWNIDRITKAANDYHDDGIPARRQTELELCSAIVEDIDFDSLNLFCSQPGTLFRDHEVVNLRTDNGYKGYKDGVLTIRENGQKTVIELDSKEDRERALKEHFGLNY